MTWPRAPRRPMVIAAVALVAALLPVPSRPDGQVPDPARPSPAAAAALADAAKALLLGQDSEGAVERYDQLRRLDPLEGGVVWAPVERLQLAEALLELGRHEEAVLQVSRARVDDPKLWRAFYVLGRIHTDARDYVRATDALSPCAFPSDKAIVPTNDRRDCLFAIAGVYVRTLRYARALETLELVVGPEVAGDLTEEDRDGVQFLRALIAYQSGDIQGAVTLFRANLSSARPSPWAAGHYALLTDAIEPVAPSSLIALLKGDVVMSRSPSFALMARVALAARRPDRAAIGPLASEALANLYVRRREPAHLREPIAADVLRELQRTIEADFAQAFLDEVERAPGTLALLHERPGASVNVHRSKASRWAHLEVVLHGPGGLKGILVRGGQTPTIKVSLPELRGRQQGPTLRLFVPVPLAAGTNTITIAAEMIGRPEPLVLEVKSIEATPRPSRLHGLVVGADQYKAPGLRAVPTAQDDARRVAAALRNLVPGEQPAVELLVGDRGGKRRVREWLATPRRENDMLFVFLRGLRTFLPTDSPAQLAFVPSDGVPGQPDTLITYRELAEWLAEAGPANALVVIDADTTLVPGQVLQGFLSSLFAAAGRPVQFEVPTSKNMVVVTSRSLFLGSPVSRDHGLSVMTIALLEALNGVVGRDPSALEGLLWAGDIGRYIEDYFARAPVTTIVPMLQRTVPQITSSPLQPLVADQGRLVRLVERLRPYVRDVDPDVAVLAREALRACRLTTRGDEWNARLDLLGVLMLDEGLDAATALKRWGPS